MAKAATKQVATVAALGLAVEYGAAPLGAALSAAAAATIPFATPLLIPATGAAAVAIGATYGLSYLPGGDKVIEFGGGVLTKIGRAAASGLISGMGQVGLDHLAKPVFAAVAMNQALDKSGMGDTEVGKVLKTGTAAVTQFAILALAVKGAAGHISPS